MSAPAPEPDDELLLDSGAYELARQYSAADDAVKTALERRNQIREQLLKIMDGRRAGLYAGQRVITVARSWPRRFDAEAFAADHPGLYETYRVAATKEVQRLSVILPREDQP